MAPKKPRPASKKKSIAAPGPSPSSGSDGGHGGIGGPAYLVDDFPKDTLLTDKVVRLFGRQVEGVDVAPGLMLPLEAKLKATSGKPEKRGATRRRIGQSFFGEIVTSEPTPPIRKRRRTTRGSRSPRGSTPSPISGSTRDCSSRRSSSCAGRANG